MINVAEDLLAPTGYAIRELRKQHGMTQKELAIKLGVSPHTVFNWEKGLTEISWSSISKLISVFNLDYSTFYSYVLSFNEVV